MFKSQIEAILKLDPYSRKVFKGVYAIDQLPELEKNAAYIINYDEHDEPGSHWIAIFKSKSQVEYFDSTGQPPLDSRLTTFVGSNYLYNPYQLQQPLGNACGFYSTYYILKRSRRCTANDILRLFVRTNSDYIVKKFLYKHYKLIFK